MKAGYDDFFRKARVNAGVTKESASAQSAPKAESARGAARRSENRGTAAMSRGKTSASSDRERLQQVRERIRQRRARRPRRVPYRLILGSLLGLVAAGAGLHYHEQIDRFLGRIEIGAMSTAVASEAAKPAAAAAQNGATAPTGERAPAAVDAKAVRKEWTDDEINHLQKLVERKEQLDAREAELGRMEAELNAQKQEIEKKLKAMDETRAGISNMLQERATQDTEKVETLVQVYSNMKPSNAAKVLESMDEDLAVEIIGRMKKKNAAEVLNLMKPEKAQSFSEKFAGYRKK